MTGECPFRDSGGGVPPPPVPLSQQGSGAQMKAAPPPLGGGRANAQTLGIRPSDLPPKAWLQVILKEGLQFKVTVPSLPPES